MSQEYDLISAAAAILQVAADTLKDMLNIKLGGDLPDKSNQHLATVWESLIELPKDLRKLKCKLEENGFESAKKGKSKCSEDGLGSEDHTNQFWEDMEDRSQDLADFINTSFDPKKH
ncbi:hypothetical protein FRC10_001975, partial [Ceratobasidium sp. 414]